MSDCYTYVARHAWAGSFGDPQWSCDSLRELEPAGIDRYRLVVERLDPEDAKGRGRRKERK